MKYYQISHSALVVDKSLVTLVSAVDGCVSVRVCMCVWSWCVYLRFWESTLEICLLLVPVNLHFLLFHAYKPRKAKRKFARLSGTQILVICLLGYKRWSCSREHLGIDEGNWFIWMQYSANAIRPQVQSLMGHLELHTDETQLHSISTTWTFLSCTFSVHSWARKGRHEKSMAMKITKEEMAHRVGPANGKYYLCDIMTDYIANTWCLCKYKELNICTWISIFFSMISFSVEPSG